MKKLTLIILILLSNHSHAEIFKCIDKKGLVHFQDQICTYEKGKLAAYQPSGQYENRDPVEVQNEITTLQNQVNNRNNGHYRSSPESNALIENKRRKDADNQQRWDSLGRAGVTFSNSPSTYSQTRFAQH